MSARLLDRAAAYYHLKGSAAYYPHATYYHLNGATDLASIQVVGLESPFTSMARPSINLALRWG